MTIASGAGTAGGVRRDDTSGAPAVDERLPENSEDGAGTGREEKERLDREAGDVADDLADFA